MNKAKSTELMMMVSRNTQMTAQAMHGAGIDDKQAAQAAAMAIEAIKAGQDGKGYAQFAKSSEMQNFMQNGMQYSGDTLGDMIKARALGDTGTMTWEKRQSIAESQQGGFNSNPEYLDNIMAQAKLATASEGSTSKAMAGFLGERVFTGLKGASIQKTVDMYNDRKDGKNIFDRAQAGKLSDPDQKEMDKWKKEIGDNPANDKLAREARREQLHIEAGEMLNEIIGGLEDAALNMTNSILHTQSAKELVSVVKQFSDSMKDVSEFLKDPTEKTKEIMKKGVGWDDEGTAEKTVSWLMGWDNKKSEKKQNNENGASGGWGNEDAPQPTQSQFTVPAFIERSKRRWGFAPSEAQAAGIPNSATVRQPLPARPGQIDFAAESKKITQPQEHVKDGESVTRIRQVDPEMADKLQNISPDMRDKAARLLERLRPEYEKRGINLHVGDTLRSIEDQRKAIAEGKSRLKDPSRGKHIADKDGKSHAMDIMGIKGGKIVAPDAELYKIQKKIMEEEGLAGVGSWDPGHVEDPNYKPQTKWGNKKHREGHPAVPSQNYNTYTMQGGTDQLLQMAVNLLAEIARNTFRGYAQPIIVK